MSSLIICPLKLKKKINAKKFYTVFVFILNHFTLHKVFFHKYINFPHICTIEIFIFCPLPEIHSGATGSTWHTSRGTQALSFSLRPESSRRSGWISLKWPCKYKEVWTPRSWQFVSHAGGRCACVCMVFICPCLHVCCTQAQRCVNSVWLSFSYNQAHTADKNTIVHMQMSVAAGWSRIWDTKLWNQRFFKDEPLWVISGDFIFKAGFWHWKHMELRKYNQKVCSS